jgi:hypothetical protein
LNYYIYKDRKIEKTLTQINPKPNIYKKFRCDRDLVDYYDSSQEKFEVKDNYQCRKILFYLNIKIKVYVHVYLI